MSWDEAVMPRLMSNVGGKQWPDQVNEHAPEGAEVTQHAWRGAWVVVAQGSYDMHSITPLADALETAAKKHPKVVLDASGVDFADSTFLNLLIRTHQLGNLRVAAPPQQLQRLFEITGADTVLQIRGTVEAAAVA
ncbi:STAS domain-containing protein [Streptomyces sp. NPDC007905]|uniref:STAS domain-containing protein n=1 Tax=Streptomyces sp. NPDC007905 TaxID=3364788 RepID=UPI0036E31AF6